MIQFSTRPSWITPKFAVLGVTELVHDHGSAHACTVCTNEADAEAIRRRLSRQLRRKGRELPWKLVHDVPPHLAVTNPCRCPNHHDCQHWTFIAVCSNEPQKE